MELKILNVSIDLSKIPQDKIIKTDKEGNPFKNGGQFVRLSVFINEEEDEYGKDVKIVMGKTKDVQEATVYIGDGNTVKAK